MIENAFHNSDCVKELPDMNWLFTLDYNDFLDLDCQEKTDSRTVRHRELVDKILN